MNSAPLLADAILPSLVLIWPITILLLIPVILIEGQYARKKLNLTTGQAMQVFGVSNIISTIIGVPIALVLAGTFQTRIETQLFGSRAENWDKWSRSGNLTQLSRAFGQYPRWTLILAAALMLGICFLISWWTETVYLNWWMGREHGNSGCKDLGASSIVRNANLLSYALVTAASVAILSWL